MSGTRILAVILILAGIAGFIYGSVTYTKETHDADLGPLEFSVQEKETVNIPVWVSSAAVVAGAGLLLFGKKKSA